MINDNTDYNTPYVKISINQESYEDTWANFMEQLLLTWREWQKLK